MPSATLTPYEQVPETKETLDWAELVTLDLSQWDKPGGKQRLARQLEHAVHHVGFFYVQNFGISQEEVDRQFALGRYVVFSGAKSPSSYDPRSSFSI